MRTKATVFEPQSPLAIVICMAVAVLVTGVVSAQPLEVPGETWLDTLPVIIDLDGATVEVIRESTTSPGVRARVRAETEEVPVLDVVRHGSSVEIRRGGEGTAPLVLELVLDLVQPLTIAGSGLEITVAGAGAELFQGEADPQEKPDVDERSDEEDDGSDEEEDEFDEDAEEVGATGAGHENSLVRLTLAVEDSIVGLTAISGAEIEAVGGSLFTDGTGGHLNLRLEGGDAEIRNHRGQVTVRGLGSEIWLVEPQGTLEFAVENGSFRVQGGQGSATATSKGGQVDLDGWGGPLQLNAIETTLDYRTAAESRSHVNLDGQRLDATVTGLVGMLNAKLRGGRLAVYEKRGNTQIFASEGAEIDIERGHGNYTLNLEQASARLSDVNAPNIKVDLREGRFDGERIRHLELVAEGGEVHAAGLEELSKADVLDTRLELDLTSLKRPPVLNLRGSSEAYLQLATPCAVELTEAQLLSDHIEITGCEFYTLSHRRSLGSRNRERGVDGNSRMMLRATMAEESHLEVEGYP